MTTRYNLILSLWFATLGLSLAEDPLRQSCTTDIDCAVADTLCTNGRCECAPGFIVGDSGYYCKKVKIGTICPAGADGDAFCSNGVTGSICDSTFNICRCPDGYGNVVGLGYNRCAAKMTAPECSTCIATGGICQDVDADGTADKCGCSEYQTSSDPEDSLTTGCDINEVPTGSFCSPDGEVVCSDPHSECRYNNDLSLNYYCICKLGFAPIPRPHDPVHADCREITNAILDPDCAACETNGGTCYTLNANKTMDGCHCPASRTSSSRAPEDACDTNHFVLNCSSSDPELCYKPMSNPGHVYVSEKLDSSKAKLYVKGHSDKVACQLMKKGDGYCIKHKQAARYCGAETEETTQQTMYNNWIVLQHNANFASAADISFHAYCRYDKIARLSTSDVVVAQRKVLASEGVHLKPTLVMTAMDRFGASAEIAGVKLGDQLKLKIAVTNNRGVFTSLRAEVCIVSDHLTLSLPETEAVGFIMNRLAHSGQAVGFIMNSCPVESSFLSRGTNFYPVAGDPLTINTGFFSVPKFADGDYVFFHCAVRVCIDENNCAPEDCSTGALPARKRRSLFNRGLPTTSHQLVTLQMTKRSTRHSLFDVDQAMESPDLAHQTIGIRVNRDDSRAPVDAKHAYAQPGHTLVYPEGYGKDGYGDDFYYRPGYPHQQPHVEPQSTGTGFVLAIAVIGSSLATLFFAAIVFMVCYIWPKRKTSKEEKMIKEENMS